MTIHLSTDREEFVRSLVQRGRFASEDAAVEEAIRLLEQHYREPSKDLEAHDEAAITARQLENLKRLCEKLDNMPTANLADGLSNRDHDQILYGK